MMILMNPFDSIQVSDYLIYSTTAYELTFDRVNLTLRIEILTEFIRACNMIW